MLFTQLLMTFYFSLRHVGGLTDEKLLVVHGMKDAQVDVAQSWTLAQALIGRGILFTQMVRLSSFE